MAERRLILRPAAWPWWGQVLGVFAASRVVTTVILLAFAASQPQTGRTPSSPGYFTFASIWDGQWYWRVALTGYPSALPLDAAGHVTENAWAFMPAYPFLVRALGFGVIPFPVLAPLVSVAFALGAALLFHRLMSRVLPHGSALFAVALFCAAPLSPILQVSYAESMQLFLLFLALLLVRARRYGWLVPVMAVLAVTRPGVLAFALLLGLHGIHRFVTRDRDPFPPRERAVLGAVTAFTIVAGLTWPAIAWFVTGSPGAYVDTELAWRAGYVGRGALVPFAPWFLGAEWWLGWWGVPDAAAGVAGAVAVVALVAAFAGFLVSPWASRLGVDLRLWLASYALYLLAVFFPQSSTFRLLMPLAPALGALAVPRSRVLRTVLIVLGVVGQVLWVDVAWRVDGADWTPP